MSRTANTLSQMQYTFCTNYVKNGFNAYRAAIDAGYTETTADTKAHKMIQKPAIKQFIERAQAKQVNNISKAYEWKVKKLMTVINQWIPDDITNADEDKVNVALRAMAELNKMHGDYAPQKHFNMTVGATLDRLQDAKKSYEEF